VPCESYFVVSIISEKFLYENGDETEFEYLDMVELNGQTYVALTPVHENPEDLVDYDGELIILRSEKDENGEELLVSIEDEDEFDNVLDEFEKILEEDFDIDVGEDAEE
jgi:uncharacterized protein YrzB (UPF0473 family)